jgi:outer membrane biosynthesis protein TonB
MRRELAGLRAARIRPMSVVQVAVAAAGVLFLAACAPVDASDAGLTAPAPRITATPTTTPTTAAPTSTAPTTVRTTAAPTSAAPSAGSVAPLPKPKPRPAPKPAPKPKPAPAPNPSPAPTPAPAPSTCDPSYAGQCLKDGIGDYDCSSGSGNGPNYVYGTVRVVGSDPFGLDRDNDGLGCEDG